MSTGPLQSAYSHNPNSSGSSAIYGSIANLSSAAPAINGATASLNGGGMYGQSTNASGVGFGVWGESSAGGGYGVVGRGLATSGANVGVYASSASPKGYAFYGAIGQNYLAGNTGIGVGVSSPAATLEVDGTVRFDSIASLAVGAGTSYMLGIKANGDLVKQPVPLGGGIKEFRGAGTTNWTIPSGVTRLYVKMWGGGGGGKTIVSGGSAAYIECALDTTIGSYPSGLTVVVGAGGAVNGNGGDTTISITGGSAFLTARGGSSTGAGGIPTVGIGGLNCISQSGFTIGAGGQVFAPPAYPGPNEIVVSGSLGEFKSVGTGGLGGVAAPYSGAPGAVTIQW